MCETAFNMIKSESAERATRNNAGQALASEVRPFIS